MLNHRLGAIQSPRAAIAIAIALGARRHSGEFVVTIRLAVRERDNTRPVDQSAEQRPLRVIAAASNGLADDERIEKQLDHEPAPEALEHDCNIKAAAAEAAARFIEQRADNAYALRNDSTTHC